MAEPQVAASPGFYATIPQPIIAQQFIDETTVMTICTVYSITVTYDSGGAKTALARVGTPVQSYLMSSTDWMVLGPNIEGVYADVAFQSLFATSGSELVVYVSPVNGDPSSAQLALYSTAATTCSVDWGDGNSDAGIAVPAEVGPPAVVTHTYSTGDARQKIVVTPTSGPSVTCYFVVVTAAAVEAMSLRGGGDVAPPPDQTSSGGVDEGATFDMTTMVEQLTDQSQATPAPVQVINPDDAGEWTPEQMARLEAGLSPYDEGSS